MKYKIEFDLPDNDTVMKNIKTANVYWGIWGYCGYAKPVPIRRENEKTDNSSIDTDNGNDSFCG